MSTYSLPALADSRSTGRRLGELGLAGFAAGGGAIALVLFALSAGGLAAAVGLEAAAAVAERTCGGETHPRMRR